MTTHVKSRAWRATLVLGLACACAGSGSPSQPAGASIQTSSPTAGVTAVIIGDRVQIRNDLPMPARYALFEQRYLDETLASYCFGSGTCGDPLPRGGTVTPLVSSATGMTSSATKLVVVWWPIPDEPPPMGGPTTPYKIVLDVR